MDKHLKYYFVIAELHFLTYVHFFSFPYQFLPENQEIRHCKNNFVKSTVY